MTFTLYPSSLIQATQNKFKAFSDETYQLLNEADEYYDNLSQAYLGLSGKSHLQHKQQLIKDIKKIVSKHFETI